MTSEATDMQFLWAIDIEEDSDLNDMHNPYIASHSWQEWKSTARASLNAEAQAETRFWTLAPNRKNHFKENAARRISEARKTFADYCSSELDMTRNTAKRILSLASMRALPLSEDGQGPLSDHRPYEVNRIYSNVLHILIPYFATLNTEESLQLLTVLRDPLFENLPNDGVCVDEDWRLQIACVHLLLLGQPSLDFCINLFKQFFSPLVTLDEKIHLLKRVLPYFIYKEPYRFVALELFATLCQKGLHPSLINMIMAVLRSVDDENAVTALYPVLYSYARTFKYPIIYQRDVDNPAYGTVGGPIQVEEDLHLARPNMSSDYCSVRNKDAEDASIEFNALVDYYHRSRPPTHQCQEGDQCSDAPERLRWDTRGKEAYKCFVCLRPARTKCSRCEVIRFCSTSCQAEAWTAEIGHKHFCPIIRNAKLGKLRYYE